MISRNSAVDFMRTEQSTLPTPDALMEALVEQQKQLEKKALIAVLEERLRLKDQRLFGASSEKNLSQQDWLADEAELLADGQPDPDDGEEATDEQDNKPLP